MVAATHTAEDLRGATNIHVVFVPGLFDKLIKVILDIKEDAPQEYLTRKNTSLNGANLPYRVHEATACYSASQECPGWIANLP